MFVPVNDEGTAAIPRPEEVNVLLETVALVQFKEMPFPSPTNVFDRMLGPSTTTAIPPVSRSSPRIVLPEIVTAFAEAYTPSPPRCLGSLTIIEFEVTPALTWYK